MRELTEKSYSLTGSNLIKIAASVFLVLGLNTNPASAQNIGHEGLETVYHIYNGGGYIGAVNESDKVEELVDAKIASAGEEFAELKLEPDASFSVITEQVFEPAVQNEEEVLAKLGEELDVQAATFALTIDGQAVAQLADRAAYDEAIRQVLLAYTSPEELEQWEAMEHSTEELPEPGEDETRITLIDIEDNVSGVTSQAAPEEVMSPEQAASLLLEDKDITVTVEKQKKVKQGIDFGTLEKEDAELLIGESKIAQEGKAGEKQVLYAIRQKDGVQTDRHTVDEKVTAEPVEEIVLNGTKEIPSVGTGSFVWPAQGGYISSKKGPRWGRQHKGIDIAQPDGFDILASDHGVVKAAGADGSFGNRVIIDHQNGYETIYAHLASIGVKVGDKVPQGTKIGVMGTTGRSTGIHLHFEISKNGAVQDPLNYISQ
ncbi:peptidoglycan DD-metalloendopeptidase family protein [Planococcus sp. CAU13]|uniref:peptidoglycan DD-metalloendopeptidase family protein n=1 Tax=Planococcus sp. CAU13 TaxID=1541197 RepID=UPI00068BF92C|nr:M23 family metallopeptidase [Planococcus sp. CAU13]